MALRRTMSRLCKAASSGRTSADLIRATTCQQLGMSPPVLEFLETAIKEDLTVPFLARYRRHLTGGLNETQLEHAFATIVELRQVFAARDKILADLTERSLITPQLAERINAATTMSQLDALYHPFRLVRKTLAAKAREEGLDKWATLLLTTDEVMPPDFFRLTEDQKKLVRAVVEEALSQVHDAVLAAEKGVRNASVNITFAPKGRKANVKDLTDAEFASRQQHFRNYDEKIYRAGSLSMEAHHIFAVFRGEAQGFLKIDFVVPHGLRSALEALLHAQYPRLKKRLMRGGGNEQVSILMCEAVKAALDDHVFPHAERLVRGEMKKKAEAESLAIFRRNLRRLLTQRPLKGHVLLAVDPGIGNGCKWAILSPNGDVITFGKFFIAGLMKEGVLTTRSIGTELKSLRASIVEHNVTRIAVGDGTGSYEAETVVMRLVTEDQELRHRGIETCRSSEHGASIYSASPVAQEELGHMDLLFRSAVSIGRRVLDPLSEYVKIPVQSLGVGLYQHDISAKQLEKCLTDAAVSVVAQVGVDINTASKHVLAKVPGLNEKIAQAIVLYRTAQGSFKSRSALQEVPGVTKTTFLKFAGFVRVPGSTDRLDDTAVHPETYPATRRLLSKAGVNLNADSWAIIMTKVRDAFNITGAVAARAERPAIAVTSESNVPILVPSFPSGDDADFIELPPNKVDEIASSVGIASAQVTQILSALCAPRVDPRANFNYAGLFMKEYRTLSRLRVGQRLLGFVQNVVPFGAWVDVGVEVIAFVHVTGLIDEHDRPIGTKAGHFIAPCDVVTCVVEFVDVSAAEKSHHHRNAGHALRVKVVVPSASIPAPLADEGQQAQRRRSRSPPAAAAAARADGEPLVIHAERPPQPRAASDAMPTEASTAVPEEPAAQQDAVDTSGDGGPVVGAASKGRRGRPPGSRRVRDDASEATAVTTDSKPRKPKQHRAEVLEESTSTQVEPHNDDAIEDDDDVALIVDLAPRKPSSRAAAKPSKLMDL